MAAAGFFEAFVKKKDENWCFCVDYQCLKVVPKKDSFSLSCIDDALDYFGDSQ